MTFEGTISKILTLFGVMLLGVFVVFATAINNPSMMMMYWLVGAIGSFILSLVLWIARPENPQMVVLPHAFLEGLFVGGISLFAEMFYPGIALNAGLITTGIVGSMFAFFKFTGFRASRGFNMVLGSAVIQPYQGCSETVHTRFPPCCCHLQMAENTAIIHETESRQSQPIDASMETST